MNPQARPAIPGASAASCTICRAPTIMRVIVGDGFAPVCAGDCEREFERRRFIELRNIERQAGRKACDERPENVWSAIVNGVTPGPCPHFPTRLTPCTECESDGPRPCPRCGGQLRYIGKDRWQCDATMCPFYRVNGEPRRPRETTRPKGPWLIRLQTDDRIGAHFLCAIGETPWWSQEHKAMRFPEHSDAFFTGGHLGVPVLIVEAADSVGPATKDGSK